MTYKNKLIIILIFSISYCLFLTACISPVFADNGIVNLKLAKENNWVGETLDGYIDILDETYHSSPMTRERLLKFVDEINHKRAEAYRKIASENHLSTEIIAKIAGQKQIEMASKGHYIKGINGQWTQKK
ncbi:YdbL family protein [Thorsellia anophelis]|uniref:DUF1318 domain-containing protein n=1 Tax=Thorsellia anophelis DSM 18579 TaxID=1123402 RepID=A0A1I0ECY9_9GAMM|nr:YdbL family protein [Thorsellia anophelis]SET43071.1 hypothetical protein SAMN02583745_02336 [Thorsellia anophelis DSM 18579]